MPRVIKKRVDTKEGREEDLKETIGDIRERLKEKQRLLIYALVVFVLITASVGGFIVYSRVSLSKAAELEAEAYKVFYGEAGTPPAASADRYKKALQLFKESYGQKRTAPVLLYIANCYYELGNYDDTIRTLKDFQNQFSDPELVPLSYMKMAMAFLKKNESDNALTTLKSLYSIKNSALQDVALMESAKILESQGKSEEARNTYQELVNKFPQSPLAGEVKKKLGEK
ncbi:MAG TPA: tetratricopeptide repeat protein [Dissulfurispiraceae bacterium]|nr:tetratricopeptide repeat protein [Dissulfurispiraceae bacterium]